ncbi:hypothetical protein PPTG_05396 [Phytophthora nicotianae INRA-310]|uniref:Uncharacterized protein n=1 Tax=Phytophthora nicotianae (strain INRA-310) TaxID=761204 RepID=W2QWY3_PHYN3|nr:hypothetical protein PPTG_05396 [Phytophthora nicotianae INRA-310]ETN17648.1 hypothetical protein PPTG_05396 [Phytophthora nicotianae INRA-310]
MAPFFRRFSFRFGDRDPSQEAGVGVTGLETQLITGHPLVEDATAGTTTPTTRPTSFALLGQRFVWSSFIFTRLVYDQVLQDDTKPARRIPSAVDVAFALFGNNEAATEIARRMEDHAPEPDDTNCDGKEFVPHRDGIQFASNLVALRQVIDEEFNDDDDSKPRTTATGNSSISSLWLQALRALSRPSPNSASTFHTSTWQRRQMNTQIASFTQLRHGSVLYAKLHVHSNVRVSRRHGRSLPALLEEDVRGGSASKSIAGGIFHREEFFDNFTRQ